jgi:hypothetical protein
VKNNIPLPVLIEDLIKKVSNTKISVEDRQHYAATLRNINTAISATLSQFDKEYKDYFKR